MILNREIGMETGTFLSDRLSVTLQIIIIYITGSSMIAAPAVLYPKANKRQFYTYFIKNRHNSDSYNVKENDTIEVDRPLIYRDMFMNPYSNKKSATWNFPEGKNRDAFVRRNRMLNGVGVRRSFERADGMTRILTFPLKDKDRGIINGFEAEDPAADCLTGGLDAGVVNGALKIGIGLGLAPNCGVHKEQQSKLVPVPIFVPRPVPVPIPVPQPFPVDVPRPIPVHVPIPFPSINMGPPPMMGIMQQFSSDVMKNRRDCIFQNCGQSMDIIKDATAKHMDNKKYRVVKERNEYAENTIIPEPKYIMYHSLKSKNETN